MSQAEDGRKLRRAEPFVASPADYEEFSPLRRSFDSLFLRGFQRVVASLARHWLAIFNAWMAVFATLPLVAPLLAAAGQKGPAGGIYLAYSLVCHQAPERSFHLLGYPMAYCQRDTSVYLAILVAGLLYTKVRWRLRPLDWRIYLLMLAPMAVDGITQLLGWRESTWELRTVTGVLFGLATVWLAYPLFDETMNELEQQMTAPADLQR